MTQQELESWIIKFRETFSPIEDKLNQCVNLLSGTKPGLFNEYHKAELLFLELLTTSCSDNSEQFYELLMSFIYDYRYGKDRMVAGEIGKTRRIKNIKDFAKLMKQLNYLKG